MEKQKSERGGLKTSMIEVCSVIIYDFAIVFFTKLLYCFFIGNSDKVSKKKVVEESPSSYSTSEQEEEAEVIESRSKKKHDGGML